MKRDLMRRLCEEKVQMDEKLVAAVFTFIRKGYRMDTAPGGNTQFLLPTRSF